MDARQTLASTIFCMITGLMVGCQNTQTSLPQRPHFPMVLEVGKDTTRELLGASYSGSDKYLAVLEQQSQMELMDRVRQHCPFQNTEFRQEEENPSWTLDLTLDWAPYRVFLVSYGRWSHQVILGTNDGRYHLLMLDLVSGGWAGGPKLEIVQVADQPVLVYRSDLGGNSCWELTGYFVQDGASVEVVNVDKIIRETLQKVLPKGCFVWNGSGFNLAELKYEQCVWGPDDCHASPTKGTIRIDFDLVDHDFIPRRYSYSPEGTWEFSDFVTLSK